MSLEFKLPDLGEGIHEAEVLAVKVKPGQTIAEDDPIFEVETDKAVVEIPSPFAGVVENVNVAVGQTVKVGTVMVTLKSETATGPADKKGSAQSEQTGSAAGKKEAPVPVESSSPGSAADRSLDLAKPGGNLATDVVPAAPSTRKLARELGVNLHMVKGTGSGGRVLSEDVRSFAAKSLEPMISGSKAGSPGAKSAVDLGFAVAPPLPDFAKYGEVERVPLRSVRRK